MILEGEDPNSDLSEFSVKISGISGNTVTTPGFYTVTVTNTNTGNSCWGNISVEDKLQPVIENCPCAIGNSDPDCEFLCTEEQGILNRSVVVPSPQVNENCGQFTTAISDQVIENGCGSKLIRRTYIFTDKYGNKSVPCTAEYVLVPATLADVTPPIKEVELTCGADTSPEGIVAYMLPSVIDLPWAWRYAYPTINGKRLNGNLCNMVATKSDTEVYPCGQTCSSSTKIIRTWLVIDWCTSETANFIQIIKATDSEAPTIQVAGFTKSVDPWGCVGNFYMPAPDVLHDNCTDGVTYSVHGPIGVNVTYDVIEGKYLVQGAPKGTHTFVYTAADCCGNTTNLDVIVNIIDKTPPVAVAKQNIVISLTNGGSSTGIAKLFANSVDNGSHDGCTAVHLEVRREVDPTKDEDDCGYSGNLTYNSDGHPQDGSSNPAHSNYDPDNGAYVKFCCSDLTDQEGTVAFGIVKVWLRVWDDGDMNGVFGSAGDNYNETWAYVRVEDKLPPHIYCPADVTIDCDEDIDNLELTGEATAESNCLTLDTEYADLNYLNACGSGYVLRKWSIVGAPGIFCVQRINVETPVAFTGSSIVWPSDETTNCTNIENTQKPSWTAGPCDLIGYSIESDTFKFEDGACFKIVNKWTVIDWCQYEPNGYNNLGIWTHTQIIKVIDLVAPVLNCEPSMYAVDDNGDTDNDGDKCEKRQLMLTNSAVDNGDCASNWLKWTVLVDLWGDGTNEYEYSSYLPTFDNQFNDSNGNGIPDRYVAPTSSGEVVKITIPEDIYASMVNHKISWKVSDGCGNITSCSTTFMVVDKKDPTPYCVSISSALMDNGQVELWARDFDLGSFDNCTDKEDLLFTFEGAHPVLTKLGQEHYFKGEGLNASASEYNAGNAQKWVPSTNSSAKVFNCEDLPSVEVNMSVWDEKLNTDFCAVILNLVDNQDACGEGERASISGDLFTANGEEVPGAMVKLEGQIDDVNQQMLNTTNGYVFNNVLMNLNYNIGAEKNDDYLNGVSTLDIVLIQRHILGLSKFDSPYNIISADVTNDEKVTASDLVQLRKLVLGLIDILPNNNSWRFVDPSTVMNDTNPWTLDETVNIVDLHNNMTNQNLIALKVGDVNNSVELSLNKKDNSDSRNNLTTQLSTHDVWMNAGKEFEITLDVNTNESIFGLQLELKTEGINIIDVTSSEFNLTESNVLLAENSLKLSVSEAAGIYATNGILTLRVKATKDTYLSNSLFIESNVLNSEVYLGENINTQNLNLVITKTESDLREFVVYQNEPNPFNTTTIVRFNLPESDNVNFTIYDITGKVVFNNSGSYTKGEHSIVVNKSTLGSHGVYYYKLESGNYSDTKKMISLE
jgi:hypothetical protein